MRTILLILAALCGFTMLASADDAIDIKATTIHLDKTGNAVSVAKNGAFVQLMIRQATKDHTDKTGVVVLFEDSEAKLTRRQAVELTKVLDDTIRRIGKADSDDAVERKPFNLFRLVGTDGYRYLDGVGMSNAYPTVTNPPTCGPGGCSSAPYVAGRSGDCSSGACGQRNYANYGGRQRVFRGGGRFRWRGCR